MKFEAFSFSHRLDAAYTTLWSKSADAEASSSLSAEQICHCRPRRRKAEHMCRQSLSL